MADRTVTVKISAQDSFSDVLTKYNAELGTAQQTTERTTSATSGLQNAIQGAIGAIGIQQVIHFAEGFQQLGDEVNVSRAQFAQLTQDMGGSARVLDQLRESTNGVTDDMTLMNASSQLLTAGLVSNSGELSKMLGYLQDLKQPTQSLDDAIGTLSQTLQTGSTRGLNQFGVNVDFVKKRIDELTASGLSAQDALKQAVFDGMADSLNRLGDAAKADETPLKKLQTQIENLQQAAASNFAAGVEGIISYGDAVVDQSTRIQQQINLLQQMGVQPQGNNDAQNALFSALGIVHTGGDTYTDDQLQVAQRLLQWTNQLTGAWKQATQALSDYHQQQNDLAREAEAKAALNQRFAGSMQSITAIQQQIQDIYSRYSQNTETMPTYLTFGQAGSIGALSDNLLDSIKAAKDEFKDLIPADQLAQLDSMAEAAKKMADQAQKAGDAFKNMKLSDILGTGSGGIGGEIADQVMAAAQKSGMSDSNLQALQDALDLSNGRQTSASQAEQKFAAGLVGLPPDEVAKAISNWVASQQAAALAGLSGAQLAGSEQFFAGMVGGGASQKITIKPGQGLNEVMRQYGLTQAQLQSAGAMMGNGKGVLQGNFTVPGMGQLDPNFNPQNAIDQFKTMLNQQGGAMGQGGMDFASQTTQAKDDMSDMLNSSQGMKSQFDQIGETLGKIANMSFNWKISADAPDWLKALFASGGMDFGAQMAKATQSNGGRPPGATSAKPRGGPIVEQR